MANQNWFDFEKDIVELMDQLEKAKDTHEKGKLDRYAVDLGKQN
jgi:hypothetical protein